MPPRRRSRRLERTGILLLKLFAVWLVLAIVGALHIPLISGAARIASGIVAIIIEVIIAFFIILIILYILEIEVPIFNATEPGPPPPKRGRPGKSGWNARTSEWKRVIEENKALIREIAEELREEAERAAEAIRSAIEEFRRAGYTRRDRGYETRTATIRSGDPGRGPRTREAPSGNLFPSVLLSRFKPLELLGEGGFATVWKVASTKPPGVYALKLPRLPGDESRRIFAREAVHWSDLGVHPNIVRLYDWDTEPLPWLLVEYVPGIPVEGARARSLRELLYIKKRLPQCDALKIALDAARGLGHAHKRGIAHLDLKPSNILLAPGENGGVVAKLTDWGMSKVASGTMSVSGVSPGYMAPEHTPYSPYKEKGVGWWTDIYQLGLVLYESLTGRNYNQVLLEASAEEALSLVESEDARSLLRVMLDPDPSRRPPADRVISMLEDLLARRECSGRA